MAERAHLRRQALVAAERVWRLMRSAEAAAKKTR